MTTKGVCLSIPTVVGVFRQIQNDDRCLLCCADPHELTRRQIAQIEAIVGKTLIIASVASNNKKPPASKPEEPTE